MVDENNLGDGLEIQDSQPQDNAESTNVDSAPEGENTESSKETPAEAKESKVKALLAQVTGRIQPLLTQVKRISYY